MFKSSGNINATANAKQYKTGGYEEGKGLNERFIDLNKAAEGAPKITKGPSAQSVLKSTDFALLKGIQSGSALRHGD